MSVKNKNNYKNYKRRRVMIKKKNTTIIVIFSITHNVYRVYYNDVDIIRNGFSIGPVASHHFDRRTFMRIINSLSEY